MTAFIFSEQNDGRSRESTFNHFVEVCGMLSSIEGNKPRGEIDINDALCKSLAWFFPLIAKFGVASLESLIYRKYPGVCPYCRRSPHSDVHCKSVLGLRPGVLNHDELKRKATDTFDRRPRSLDQWQAMFNDVYPRTVSDSRGRNSLGLMEELGELAEAIRVFERQPRYFVGEAADVFSYLMGFANDHQIRLMHDGQVFSLESEYLARYPGMCIDCGYPKCRCPHIPDATIGRMAKELELDDADTIFYSKIDYTPRDNAGAEVGQKIFNQLGGYPALLKRFPFDRGQANQDMAALVIEVADRIEGDYPEFSLSLMRNALRLRQAETKAGQKDHSSEAAEAIAEIQNIFVKPKIAEKLGALELSEDSRALASILEQIEVLIVSSRSAGSPVLNIDEEFRSVREAIERAKYGKRINLRTPLLAARIEDITRELLEEKVDIIHFSVHGDGTGISVMSDDGTPFIWKFDALKEHLKTFKGIKCIVLNSCNSDVYDVDDWPAVVVAMREAIEDQAAIEFSRGFYQAIGAGKSIKYSANQGQLTARSKGWEDFEIRVSEFGSDNANKVP